MTPFIDMVVKDLKAIKSVKSVKWSDNGEPHGPHFVIIDKYDGIWRMGERYPGLKCRIYDIVTSVRNPHKTEDNPALALALTSYYQKKLRPIYQINGKYSEEGTEKYKRGLINKALASVHWQYIKNVTPDHVLFSADIKPEDFKAFCKQVTGLSKDDHYYLNGNKFKYDAEKWIAYSKIVNWHLLDIKHDLEMGLFLNHPQQIIRTYLKDRYDLAPWLAIELSYALSFCPANLSIFPFMPDVITGDIVEIIYGFFQNAKQRKQRAKNKPCGYGPREGSNWTGD